MWTGFHFSVQKRPVPESSGASLVKRPHLESRVEILVIVSASSADARKKGGCGDWHS